MCPTVVSQCKRETWRLIFSGFKVLQNKTQQNHSWNDSKWTNFPLRQKINMKFILTRKRDTGEGGTQTHVKFCNQLSTIITLTPKRKYSYPFHSLIQLHIIHLCAHSTVVVRLNIKNHVIMSNFTTQTSLCIINNMLQQHPGAPLFNFPTQTTRRRRQS